MSVLANYVQLVPNQPKRLKVKNMRIEERQITDPKTKLPKTVRALVFDVYEEDGVPVSKTFSTLSEKLAQQLKALYENGVLENKTLVITWRPRDYATEYEVYVM